MRYGWALIAAMCGACYGPAVSPGAPCGPNDQCPSGLECRNNVCVLPGSQTGGDAALPDDAAADATPLVNDAAPDATPVLGAWGTPVEIASLETPGNNETDPTISMNRLTAVIATSSTEDLYLCTRAATTAAFTCAPFAAVTSASIEKSPELSPDGLTLYLASNRGGNYDIYRSTFSTVWSAPMLQSDLSTAGDESDIAVSPDGLTAVVVDNETTNRFLVHTRATTTQAFGTGVHHPELSVLADVAAPSITNNGDIIYLHAGATRDIYVAYKKPNGDYTTPTPVTELNTTGRDGAPFVLGDDKYMVFEREGDIYETSR